jgi:SulP family sulfate permease
LEVWSLEWSPPLALAFGAIRNGGDSWSIWSNHGRDICSNIWWNTQASGPTGPMTVVSAALVAASIQLTEVWKQLWELYF